MPCTRHAHTPRTSLGSGLLVLHAADATEEAAAAAVAACAARLGVGTVVVDACEAGGEGTATLVEARLCSHHQPPIGLQRGVGVGGVGCVGGAGAGAGAGAGEQSSSVGAGLLAGVGVAAAGAVTVVAMVDDTLLPHEQLVSCLPAASAGAERGAKVLNWARFLHTAAQLSASPPHPSPASLPPPLTPAAELAAACSLPEDSAWWGRATLAGWLSISGAEISEAGGLRLARDAGRRARRKGVSGFAKGHIGERAGAGNEVAGNARSSCLSPYLRWGVLSPRQAAEAGVRLRELLWRDFSRLSWRLVPPLRAGTPVVQALLLDDAESHATTGPVRAGERATAALRGASGAPLVRGVAAGSSGAAALASAPEATHEDTPLGWLPLRSPPHGGGSGGGGGGRGVQGGGTEAADAVHGTPATLVRHAWRWTPVAAPPPGGCEPPASSWASLQGQGADDASEASEAFEAWCVGRTGSPLVDAGMVQLWASGWIPRRVRLLCAACLVEGLGLDWRLGRDWFAYALTDHDYAINETMWQNAGLVGVDPFYSALLWDETPSDANEQHVHGAAEHGQACHGHGAKPAEPVEPAAPLEVLLGGLCRAIRGCVAAATAAVDAAPAAAAAAPSNHYTRHWLSLPPGALPPWPPPLHAAAARARPPLERVQQLAAARRLALAEAYRLAERVSRVGVRVEAPPGACQTRAQPPAEPPAAPPAARLADAVVGGVQRLHSFSDAAGSLPMRDSLGVAADELCTVGHMRFRVPPITHGPGAPAR